MCVCTCVVIALGVTGISVLSSLQNFESVFGLQINLSRSGLTGIKVEDQFLYDLASMAGCAILEWPSSYLGVPLGGNPNLAAFWDLVIRKILKRLGN